MDVDKTIQFILDQQAKFFAGMEEMREESRKYQEQSRQQHEQSRQRHEEARQRHEEASRRQDRFDEQLAAVDQQLSEFAEQQRQINMSLGKAMLGLTDHVESLLSAQAVTEERLNALIAVVDGVVRRPPAA